MRVVASRRPFFAPTNLPHLDGAVQAALGSGELPPIPAAVQHGVDAQLRAHERMAVYASTPPGAGDPDALAAIREIAEGVKGMRASFEDRLKGLEASADEQAVRDAAGKLGGGGIASLPVDREYTAEFGHFARTGRGEDAIEAANRTGDRAQIVAAMSVGSNTDGGYVAPVEWDRKIQQAQRAKSPMRRLAQVQTTGVGAYSTLWNTNLWGSGWVGETAARPATTTTGLLPINFAAGELYANVPITQRLLDDAAFDLDGWIVTSIADEFERQEGVAYVSGDGVNKPMGFLQYVPGGAGAAAHPGGTLDVVPAGSTTAVTPDVLRDFLFGLAAPYRQNASWLMSSTTAAVIAKLKDAGGNALWQPELSAGLPPTLLGRPVEFDEGMPNATAGNLPIAFGDFRAGYLINDRIGIRVLRDPYTNKPFVMFYITKRVGGGVLDPKAIRVMKMAAS